MFAQKLASLLKSPEPINKIPVTLHRGGAVEAHVEQYLSTPEGLAALDTAQVHWQHWQAQRSSSAT